MMVAGGAARAQAEEEVAAGEFGELDAAHAQAGASIVFGNALDAGEGGDLLPGFGDVWRGAAAGFEAGIEIAVVARFGALQVVAFVVGEEFEAGGGGIEAEDAECGGALLAGGEVEREPFEGDAALARAEVGEPDEAEGEHGGGVGIGRAGDGGPAVLPVLEIGAREGGGEGVLEIGFGADLGEGPLGELAAQEEAEALAEDEAAGALAEFRAGAAAEIEEEELTFTAGEAFDGQGECGRWWLR